MGKFDDLNDFDASSFDTFNDNNSSFNDDTGTDFNTFDSGGDFNSFDSGGDFNSYDNSGGDFNSYDNSGGGGIGKLIGIIVLLWLLSNLGG